MKHPFIATHFHIFGIYIYLMMSSVSYIFKHPLSTKEPSLVQNSLAYTGSQCLRFLLYMFMLTPCVHVLVRF